MELESLVELKSTKIQLEFGLIYLRRKQGELQKQVAKAREERLWRPSAELERLQADLESIDQQLADREEKIAKLRGTIERTERGQNIKSDAELVSENEALAAELETVRQQVIQTICGLAGSIRRHQELVDKKTQLVRRISKTSSRDLSYPNYVECALFRQQDYSEDLEFVIETLKRARVVS